MAESSSSRSPISWPGLCGTSCGTICRAAPRVRSGSRVGGQKFTFSVSAAEFSRMSWVLRQLGPQAVIYPGQQQHARAAIQCLSKVIREERIYTHLGWRKHGPGWVYLQSDGAVARSGPVGDLRVRLATPLAHYQAFPPTDAGGLRESVRASLGFLSVAPDRISFPLLAAVYRAPFGDVDFSLFLVGRTGTFKTTLAALCQQHFGAAMDAHHLPGNFASTANALEDLAFQAKDALLVVDDFAPTGGVGDRALEGLAERLFRAAGNRQGRSRLRAASARSPSTSCASVGDWRAGPSWAQPPSPAADPGTPIWRSGPGRPYPLSGRRRRRAIGHGDGCLSGLDRARLRILAGPPAPQIAPTARRDGCCGHAFRPCAPAGNLAELHSGWEIWLEFAREIGAINRSEQAELERRSRQALKEVAAIQSSYHQASDPARLFELCCARRWCSGRAHVAGRRGEIPEFPERWGWRRGRAGLGTARDQNGLARRRGCISRTRLPAIKWLGRSQGRSTSLSASIRCRGGCTNTVCWRASMRGEGCFWCAGSWKAVPERCCI